MPRMLRGVHNRTMTTSALGFKVSAPFGIGLMTLAFLDTSCMF